MPLTEKGREIMAAMKRQYGEKKGEQVFYASKNAGKISGVDDWRGDSDIGTWWHADEQPEQPLHLRGKGYMPSEVGKTLDEIMYRHDLLKQRMDRLEGRVLK